MRNFEDIEKALDIIGELAGTAITQNPAVTIMLTLLKAEHAGNSVALDDLAKQTKLSMQSLNRYVQHLTTLGVIGIATDTVPAEGVVEIRLSVETRAQAKISFANFFE